MRGTGATGDRTLLYTGGRPGDDGVKAWRRSEEWHVSVELSRRSAELTLPAAAKSPSEARAFVNERLREWGAEDDGDVSLAVSELVTNGLLHARTPMTLRVELESDGEVVRLDVSDGSVSPPRGRRFTVESGTGRGLRLLDSLSEEWGVVPREGGKTVWCRIRLGARTYEEYDIDAVEAL